MIYQIQLHESPPKKFKNPLQIIPLLCAIFTHSPPVDFFNHHRRQPAPAADSFPPSGTSPPHPFPSQVGIAPPPPAAYSTSQTLSFHPTPCSSSVPPLPSDLPPAASPPCFFDHTLAHFPSSRLHFGGLPVTPSTLFNSVLQPQPLAPVGLSSIVTFLPTHQLSTSPFPTSISPPHVTHPNGQFPSAQTDFLQPAVGDRSPAPAPATPPTTFLLHPSPSISSEFLPRSTPLPDLFAYHTSTLLLPSSWNSRPQRPDGRCRKLLLRGEWTFHSFHMRVFKWTPSFDPQIELSITPMWIRLPELPVHLFEKNALFTLAAKIGKPLRMDELTADLSRPDLTRVFVELDLTAPRFKPFTFTLKEKPTDSK
ncbi:UNVERIFIED_CONTAM: hypothetical protein Slati_1398600 [Sesamum latifolium]|uniref:DUF4283 domain-containing protein n=1 Tax=Sesamum latifolium TaxID=2727402 RepID=A0AAW2X2H2_9LAMI